MKTQTITYAYDPGARNLTIFVDGKPKGGFIGQVAEHRFGELLESGADINITSMNTKALHSGKVRRLRALWFNQGIDKYRDAILEQYQVTSTADLSNEQLDELIRHYSHEWHPPVSDHMRRLRSDVLTLLNRLGLYSNGSDWTQINDFLMSPRISGKLLYQMDEAELGALCRKLHSIIGKKIHTTQNLN